MYLYAALALGFLGSLHCIGMCGPIALAIPVNRKSPLTIVSGSLVYNGGRMLTYAILGLISGLFGKGMALIGFQGWLSITLGTLVLANLFLPRLIRFRTGKTLRVVEVLKSKVRQLFASHSFASLSLIGLLNGLLPCGLVYLGLAGAIATGSGIHGAAFMACFGLGTLPAMLGLSFAREYVGKRFRAGLQSMLPVFVGAMGIALILRGMHLGIPYLSPDTQITKGNCHYACCAKK